MQPYLFNVNDPDKLKVQMFQSTDFTEVVFLFRVLRFCGLHRLQSKEGNIFVSQIITCLNLPSSRLPFLSSLFIISEHKIFWVADASGNGSLTGEYAFKNVKNA